jgi:hypothetical protein
MERWKIENKSRRELNWIYEERNEEGKGEIRGKMAR